MPKIETNLTNGFKKKIFMPFVVLGDPTFEKSILIIKELIKNGAGALELGFAFSDPIADGPVIQKANKRALDNGITTSKGFEIIEIIRKESNIPISLMLSYNIVYKYGEDNFYKKCSELKVNGVLVPDVPLEEATPLLTAAKKHKIAQVFLVTPTTPIERMNTIAKYAQGYVYLVSLIGTTGVRKDLDNSLPALIKETKKHFKIPVYVGFGISEAEHAKNAIRLGADGAISGSAVTKLIENNLTHSSIDKIVGDFCKKMSEAVIDA